MLVSDFTLFKVTQRDCTTAAYSPTLTRVSQNAYNVLSLSNTPPKTATMQHLTAACWSARMSAVRRAACLSARMSVEKVEIVS